jgi:hypothetical protein
MAALISPFVKPAPGLPVREGAPQITRPTKEEIDAFPTEAQALVQHNWANQKPLLEAGQYDLAWLAGRHLLIAGATGPGLGCALATAALGTGQAASVTILSRDLRRSLNFETGKAMVAQAETTGQCFHWLNEGMALEGEPLAKTLAVLKSVGADRVVYFNTVAAALSGMLPDMPPVFVKDVDETGLFQWRLAPLTEKEIEITKTIMGEMAVQFPKVLAAHGVTVEATAFADWRGSLDKASRNPDWREYGRHGAYSTSLYLPKDILQAATKAAYKSGRMVMDIFFPVMRTRALSFIPGGLAMANLNQKLMEKEGIRFLQAPELALGALDRLGKALTEGYDNPFPRLDNHDMHLDEWFFEIMERLNNDEDSDFYYKHWV